jgi:hypothetical protein
VTIDKPTTATSSFRPRFARALQLALVLERISRKFVPNAPSVPMPKFQHTSKVQDLTLEVPLYAAFKPPKEYVFMPEDEYFKRVEALLERAKS